MLFLRRKLRRFFVVLLVRVAFLARADLLQPFRQRFLDERLALRGESFTAFRIFRAIEILPAIDQVCSTCV